jgi:hypothetical protein
LWVYLASSELARLKHHPLQKNKNSKKSLTPQNPPHDERFVFYRKQNAGLGNVLFQAPMLISMTFHFSNNTLLHRLKDERIAVTVIAAGFGGNWEKCDSCPNGIHVNTNR